MMKIKSSARLIVELSLCMLSILTSLSTIQCASTAGRYTTVTETFSCQNATIKWKYLINNQDTLSQFIADVEANSTAIFTESLCIELKLSAMPATDRGVVYKLDILKLLNINLGNNGSLIFMGVPNHTHVSVDCITDNYTNLEDLNTTLKPFSKAALIVLSGLVFTRCPIPIVIEETDMVVIQNCIFV